MKILEEQKKQENENNKNNNKNGNKNKNIKDNKNNKDNKSNKGNKVTVYVNGEEVECDVPPVIKSGRFNIPVAPIAKALGAKISWDKKTGDVTISKDDIVIVIKTGSNVITVNGVEVKIDDYVQSNSNRTFVPISFISKVLKHKVIIDEDTDSIIIEDDDFITVNDNVTGTGNGQFEYSGDWKYGKQSDAYMEDNHWSSQEDAYFQVRFTGTQVKLYGAKAPNHGIAAVSIDGGKEILVDYYAEERKDDVIIYTSPILPAGQHILKVRVTGTKDIKSTGFFITADRIEIAEDVNPVVYSWIDGAPKSSVTGARAAVYLNGSDNGFQVFVPADTKEKILKVYVGAWGAKGRFEATLSDGSALPYIEYVDAKSGINCKVFTVKFKAESDNQLLTVKYTVDKVCTENIGNITLQAAALR